MLKRLGYGISGHNIPGGDIEEAPPPPAGSFLLLSDGSSFLLRADGSHKLRRPS